FKYKMSNIQAAIGCAQLERIHELTRRKQEILGIYRRAFESISGISMNPEQPYATNGAWMPTVVFDEQSGITREILQNAFLADNIDARPFFWPLTSTGLFKF